MFTIMLKKGAKLLEKVLLHLEIPEYILRQQGTIMYKIKMKLNFLIEHNKMSK